MTHQKSGYVAIIGRPNVGKSTLLNCILHKKISIVSPKPQTTRFQVLGIKTFFSDGDDYQAIYIDTPGIHEAQKNAMNRYLNRLASAVIPDADVIIFMVEAPRWTAEDELVLQRLQSAEIKAPVILVINKVDELKDKRLLLPFIQKLSEKYTFDQVIPLSALHNDNVAVLEAEVNKDLPEGPHLFPDDQVTDKNERFQIAELIREKVIQLTEKELPFSTSVQIESLEDKPNIIEISAIIWVEREGQKAIVIGQNGERLKKIGTRARKDIEILLAKKVFLRLWVKVKEKWTEDQDALKSLGYE
jgi:GTP-binding protein Era